MNTTAATMDSHDPLSDSSARDYARIEAALQWLAQSREKNPSLEQAARELGMSPFHFQRMFSRWAGVSPKQFLQHLGITAAKRRLAEGASVLDAALDAGFSGPSRLHDALVRVESVTPGEYRTGLEGVTVHYGFHPTPFGEALVLVSARGLCGLGFAANGGRDAVLDNYARRFPNARFHPDAQRTVATAEQIFNPSDCAAAPLRVFLNGTRFQVQVWRALLEVPTGALCTYQDLARRVGNPNAVRAVGSAVGANPIAYLIPCHRVIRKSGVLGSYRWGPGRKLALIGYEADAEVSAAS